MLNHPIEDGLIHIHVALLHSRTALQLEGPADHCINDRQQLLGSALLRRRTLERHGWKVISTFFCTTFCMAWISVYESTWLHCGGRIIP